MEQASSTFQQRGTIAGQIGTQGAFAFEYATSALHQAFYRMT
jgi:hypothetical protein